MRTRAPSGPSATAAWSRFEIPGPAGTGATASSSVLLLPDAANRNGGRDNLFYYLTPAPALARNAQGDPMLSLTLELSRSPSTGEATILPLVRRGWLALTLTLGLSAERRSALEAGIGASCRPLFARSVRLELVSGRTVLASVDGAGAEAPLALSATLEREPALGALAALDGARSGLALRAVLRYRNAPVASTLHLEGSYAAIHDFLSQRADADGTLEAGALREALDEMIRLRVLQATRIDSADVPPRRWTDLDALLPRFASAASFILERREGGDVFALRRRPNPLMRLDLTETVEAAAESRRELTAQLEDVLGGALERRDRDEYLHLVTAGPEGDTVPVPRLVRGRRSRGRMRDSRNDPLRLVAAPGAYTSVALAMTPDRSRAPSAHALLGSDLVHAARPGRLPFVLADDFIIERLDPDFTPSPLPLPVVDRPDAPLWSDRVDPGKFWYDPALTPIVPAPGDDPASSAYLFTFEASGATGGSTPTVGLDGSVRFTLRQTLPEATRARLQELGGPPAQPVPLGNLSVALDLPFRDEATGEVRRQLFAAEARQEGDTITATVSLINQWVRLCYGALAYAGFQKEPARIRVAYGFRAYVPVGDHRLELAFGHKIAITEIQAMARPSDPVVRPVFDPDRMAVRLPHAELRLEPERPARPGPAHFAAAGVLAASPAVFHAGAVVVRPELTIADVAEDLPETRYATRSIVREQSIDALYPCATLGAFYRQIEAGEETALGCRDTFRLGETVHRQYEELAELRDPRYRVYRSLQQPGRFLVVPAAYRITRFAASEPADRAYRPAIMIYAILGEEGTENRYFIRATLEPDLPPFARRALEERLRPQLPHQGQLVLDYPTDPTLQNPETPPGFRWKLPDGIDEPEVLQSWDGFQVSISTELANALVVTRLIESNDLVGDVTFTLPDGHPLTSELRLDTNVTGPWESGPVPVSLASGKATLTNHAERTMNVFDLVLASGSAPPRHQGVELSLEPGESAEVALDEEADSAWVIYEAVPGKLQLSQMNVFVEDVTSNVIFVNLVNFANHELGGLTVKARLKGTSQQHVLDLDEEATGSITMTLPLTTYLENQVLEFQVIKRLTGGREPVETGWMEWDLETQGNVISLTWELIE